MKFTLNWLKKFLTTEATLEEITKVLTDIGLEVEDIYDPSLKLKPFKVAEIINTRAHPEATKLQICDVRIASGEILQIVCGASNARAGIKVALAPIGAEMPDGMKIKESEIRGIKSYGMLCSEAELMIGNGNDGIIEISSSVELGEPIARLYGLDDPVIHINVTPNRSDALSVYGIARDLAARNVGTLNSPGLYRLKANYNSSFEASLLSESYSQFLLREIRGVDNNIPAPLWLKNLLEAVGIKSISAIVDITNYVLYSYGQPLHAYDANKLSGDLRAELLSESQIFKALDEKEYELTEGDLIIKDEANIQCLAGIIGSKNSSISASTNHIVLEAAVFKAENIIKTGRRLKIETDARYRFERGIDAAFTEEALDIAAGLIIEICGGELSEIVGHKEIAPKKTIKFNRKYLLKLINLDLSTFEICKILGNLGFSPSISDDDWLNLEIPSWRHDIVIQEDIVEEIVRIYGYDKIESVPLPKANLSKISTNTDAKITNLRREAASLGYNEIISYSFISQTAAELFDERPNDDLKIINPISADLSYLRSSLLPNLLQAVSSNMARSIKVVSLFELGPIFQASGKQSEMLAAIKTCSKAEAAAEILKIKADLAITLNSYGLDINKSTMSDLTAKGFHPTRSASLALGKNIIARFGQIHPQVLEALGIESEIIFFEIFIDNLPELKAKFGRREKLILSDYQMSQRDFAFVVDSEQRAGEMVSFIQNLDRKLIKSTKIFDIYDMGNNQKSVAISVQIQANDRTLNEAELVAMSREIIDKVSAKFQASLRQ